MNDVMKWLGGPKEVFKQTDSQGDAIFTMDFSQTAGETFFIGLGLEASFFRMLSVRIGVELLEDLRAFTTGFGFRTETPVGRIKADIAWVPQSVLGDNLRFTVNFMWDKRGSSLEDNRVLDHDDKDDDDSGDRRGGFN